MAHLEDRDPVAVLDEKAAAPTRTTSYGPDAAQVYDVRLPVRATRDVTVVVVHGGFWRKEYDRGHAGRQAQAFADAGFPTAVVEYRRTGMPGSSRAGSAAAYAWGAWAGEPPRSASIAPPPAPVAWPWARSRTPARLTTPRRP